jgi:hypothetical protein
MKKSSILLLSAGMAVGLAFGLTGCGSKASRESSHWSGPKLQWVDESSAAITDNLIACSGTAPDTVFILEQYQSLSNSYVYSNLSGSWKEAYHCDSAAHPTSIIAFPSRICNSDNSPWFKTGDQVMDCWITKNPVAAAGTSLVHIIYNYTNNLTDPYTVSISDDTIFTFNACWGSLISNVFAVGNGGIIFNIKNDDSGTQMTSPTTVNLKGVFGLTDFNIWAVGDSGTILKYNGTSWSAQALSPATSQSLYCIWGSGSGLWLAGGDGCYALSNDGTHWTVNSLPAIKIYGIWGTGSVIYGVGERRTGGAVDANIFQYQTGSGWTAVSGTPRNTVTLRGIWGAAANNIYAVGDGGTILHYHLH